MIDENARRTVNAVLGMLRDAAENVSDAISDLLDLKIDNGEVNLVVLAEGILLQAKGGD